MSSKTNKVFNCVIFYMYSIKIFNLHRFFLSFLIVSEIQGGRHLRCRHGSPAASQLKIYTESCRERHWQPIKDNTFSKYCNTTKTHGRGSPPLHYNGGVTLLVRLSTISSSSFPGISRTNLMTSSQLAC